MKKLTVFIISTVIMTLCACSSSQGSDHVSRSGMYFDTVVTIDIYGASETEAGKMLDECMDMCSHYEALFDKNKITSDIAMICEQSPEPVTVDDETIELINDALSYCRLTDGRFDITIAPVSALWDFHGDSTTVPAEDELKKACALVDYRNVIVDEKKHTIALMNGSSIDAGAAAKGFIADRIAGYLDTCDIKGAIINLGGDLRVLGTKTDGTPFHIGINDPGKEGVLEGLSITDRAVATSGTYERCFTVDGKTYHHILDVSTGYPVDTDIVSVTVITKDAVCADCLCTVCLIYGSDEAMKLIDDTDDTEAVMLLSDGSLLFSEGAKNYISN